MIGNSFIRDVKRKGGKKDNSDKLHNFTYNNNNNNNNNNNDNNNDKLHNFIDNVLNNNDKLHNFSDKILNNLTIVAKMKEEFLINIKKVKALINKAYNIRKDDLGLKLDEYKKINILADDLINHIWNIANGDNKVNKEINNIMVIKKKMIMNMHINI